MISRNEAHFGSRDGLAIKNQTSHTRLSSRSSNKNNLTYNEGQRKSEPSVRSGSFSIERKNNLKENLN